MTTPAHAIPAQPAVAHGGALHVVAPAASQAEREAERFADAFATEHLARGPGWSFADQPVHAAGAVGAVGVVGAALGADVSDVQVRDGADAADLTRRAGAEAVTIGREVSFAPGKRDLHSRDGVRRVAHEVVHAVKHAGTGLAFRDGPGPVTPATTLAGLPETDRKLIQVVTNTKRTAPTKDELKDKYFDKGTTLGGPSDTTIALDASVDAALVKGLTNLAGDWSTGADPFLSPNTTVTVELDLTTQGGPRAPYRFTHSLPPAAKGSPAQGRIIVEQLGATKPPAGSTKPPEPKPGETAPPDPVADKMKAASITHSGYSGAEEQALRAAIAVVPDSHLAAVKGLRFARQGKHATKPKVAGEYFQKADPAAGASKPHTIVMYDSAFGASDVVFTEGGTATSYAARLIVHEIGHAVDLVGLTNAYTDLEAATAAVDAASGTFTSAAEKKAYDDAVKAETAAKKAHKDARSRSGTRTQEKPLAKGEKKDPTKPTEYEDVIGTAHTGVPFREAVKKDGKDVSKYGEEDWQESYAEAYSLYLTAPAELKLLRPATHDFLSKNLP